MRAPFVFGEKSADCGSYRESDGRKVVGGQGRLRRHMPVVLAPQVVFKCSSEGLDVQGFLVSRNEVDVQVGFVVCHLVRKIYGVEQKLRAVGVGVVAEGFARL